MHMLRNQERLVFSVLYFGKNKVWLDPSKKDEVFNIPKLDAGKTSCLVGRAGKCA